MAARRPLLAHLAAQRRLRQSAAAPPADLSNLTEAELYRLEAILETVHARASVPTDRPLPASAWTIEEQRTVEDILAAGASRPGPPRSARRRGATGTS